MKVVLLEPASPGLHVYKGVALPRLGSLYLGTILKRAGHDVRVCAEDIKMPDPSVLLGADVVGISTITSTAPRAYEYARRLRLRGIKTVLGGPHVTFRPEEALEYADIVAIGEAENTIIPLVEALEGKRELAEVPGIAYMDGGQVRKTGPAELVRDLDELPTVDLSLLEGGLRRAFYRTVVPVMTSRGCPYNCSFCSVKEMFGRKYRFRSPTKVVEDLRAIEEVNRRHVFFYDDHFTAHRGRIRELMERLVKERFRLNFSAQVRVDIARDPELLALMKKAGLETVYVGFESVNPDTLKAYNKGQTVEEMEEAMRVFHRVGVRVHGMFVFGSDQDTVETIRETTRFAKRNGIESVQFLILTPPPGTKLYESLKAEGRLVSEYWALFDGHHVTFEPKKMTPYELQWETFKAMRDFYSFCECIKPLLRFHFFDAAVHFYGHRMVKAWTRIHQWYLRELRSSWQQALRLLEEDRRRRAAAIKVVAP